MKSILIILLLTFSVGTSAGVSPKVGRYTATFQEHHPLSRAEEIQKRTTVPIDIVREDGYTCDLNQETYDVFVPQDYDPNTAYGVVVEISPGDKGQVLFDRIEDEFTKRKLICIGADKSGNNQHVYTRRIPLALDGLHNIQKLYRIDPERIYVGGLSGGGHVSSIVAFHFSDVFTGGIFVIGASFWRPIAVPGKPGRAYQAFPAPKIRYLVEARNRGRYVLLTGEYDFNRIPMQAYYQYGYKPYLKNVLFIDVPGMKHEGPPPERLLQAIEYVDQPRNKKGD
ncbi:MAG: hypothetical protein JXA82_16125 [Sedimentisphaerales bacterium]|nr:hypothetical protein [Sedimentisphaerales bacterium]